MFPVGDGAQGTRPEMPIPWLRLLLFLSSDTELWWFLPAAVTMRHLTCELASGVQISEPSQFLTVLTSVITLETFWSLLWSSGR